jgi:hypothetical protein
MAWRPKDLLLLWKRWVEAGMPSPPPQAQKPLDLDESAWRQFQEQAKCDARAAGWYDEGYIDYLKRREKERQEVFNLVAR